MVGFSSPIYTTNGGAGYVQVCAEILKGTLEQSVSVHLTSTNDTAIIGEDYYSVDVELVFSSGQRQNDTSCANITLLDDMITDGMQKLVVSLHSNIMAVQLAEPWNATVIIDDINFLPAMPTNVTIYQSGSAELIIAWNLHPEFLEENASNLTVQMLYPNGQVASQTTVPGSIAQAKMEILPSINYTINIIAYNIDGYVFAIPTHFKTLPGDLPGAPRIAQVTYNNRPSTAVVQLSEKGSPPIIQVALVAMTPNVHWGLNICGLYMPGDKIVFNLSSLADHDTYAFAAYASNYAGDSPYSAQVTDDAFHASQDTILPLWSIVIVALVGLFVCSSFIIVVTCLRLKRAHLQGSEFISSHSCMKTETFLIAACVLLCHTCSNIGADVEIGILAIPYEINESENTTDLEICNSTLWHSQSNGSSRTSYSKRKRNKQYDYENEDNVMLFEVNSTAGATMCSYITILSNNAVHTKNFTVYLTSNSSGVLIPSYAQSVPVQILGGTTQYIDVSFTSSTYSVRENEGYVHVCIEITSGLLQRAANVYLSSLDGTAFKLTHYSPLQNASLTFLSGDQMNSTRCVNITVFDDMITGSAKFFTVLLTTYDINVHVIAPNTTTITIEESDYVTLSLTKSAYNTSESTGFVTVCAKILNGTLGRSINVYASTIDGTATGVNFIEVQSFPLLFISGKRQNDTSCFNITVIDDMITENTNYFTVYITSNDTGLKLTTPISATVSITDSNYITVRFTSPTITANESSGFAIACVEIMTGYLGRNASIYLSTVDVTAIGTTNYSPLQHREVQFVDEDTENSTACVNIVVYDNMITEDTKYFNVSITAQDTAIILVEPKTCIVGIIDSNCEL
eukprot:Em0004g1015a